MIDIRHGDCLAVMKDIPENSIDAVVTDPPYELGFMGKSWDASGIAFCPNTWREVLRVMKPGAHLVAFGAPKNYHRLACAIEDAGFEIRDSLMWVFGSGFPKSHNIGDGWGTALKPAYEPIVLARKPLSEKTVAANVLRWGTGALNIDATRVAIDPIADASQLRTMNRNQRTNDTSGQTWGMSKSDSDTPLVIRAEGRWPANLCHDGSQGVLELFPHTKSGRGNGMASVGEEGDITPLRRGNLIPRTDDGSAARFFYCAKASKQDRAGSKHPTVKPINLIRWLIRMVTPPNGLILDPFAGSGTTGAASKLEVFNAVLIERELEYFADIKRRLE